MGKSPEKYSRRVQFHEMYFVKLYSRNDPGKTRASLALRNKTIPMRAMLPDYAYPISCNRTLILSQLLYRVRNFILFK